MFGLPIQNKNSAINASLPFLFDFFESKEKYRIRRKINIQKRVYMTNQDYYSDLAKIRVDRAHRTKNKVAFALRLISVVRSE